MSYERLELIDGVTKWDTEKVQHLEDAIIKNENDIQKYHNDTIVEMQADWNQKDETAKDYVKNRTHYTSINTITILENFETECYEYFLGGGPDRMVEGLTNERFEGVVFDNTMDIESLQVFINGVQEPISRIEKYDSDTIYWHLNNGVYISVMNNNYWLIRLDYDNNTLEIGDKLNVSLFIDQATIVPLDIKYIPEEVLQQGDWSCYEADSHSYIKNRTHYTEYGWDNDMTAYDSFPRYYTIPYDETAEGLYWLGSKIFVLEEKYILTSKSDWKFVEKLADGGIYTWEQYDKENNKLVKLEVEVHNNPNVGYDTIWNYNQGYGHFEEAYEVVKTLDQKYLPPSVIDWLVNDENSSSYIKNRTHYPYKGYGQVIYHGYMRFNGDWEEWYEATNLLPYEQIIESDLTPEEAPGYWLGEMGGYYASSNGRYVIADAYSHWSIIDTNGDTTTYHYSTDIGEGSFDVSVQTMTPNKYRVTLTSAYCYGDWERTIGLLGLKYKPLDEIYIPDTIARKNSIVTSVNGKIGDVEVSYSDLGIINEEYIPEIIARKNEVETVASFSKGLENNFHQYASTNDEALNNITTNLRDIADNVQKLNNKQIEDYFIGYEEELLVDSFLQMAVNLGYLQRQIVHPLHLKFVNQLTGESQIIVEDDPYLTMEQYDICSCTYDNPEGPVVTYFATDGIREMVCNSVGNIDDIVVYQLIPVSGKKKLDEKYISDSIARAPKAILNDIEEAPTASDFNTLLSILREAGILATE